MVLGGSGFIGQNIAKYFIKGNYIKNKISKLFKLPLTIKKNLNKKKYMNFIFLKLKK